MSGACGPGHLGGCHGLTGVLAQPAMSIAGAAGAMLAASTANSLLTRQGFFALDHQTLKDLRWMNVGIRKSIH